MNKICTDINQSKKLIELGIDRNTADMFWDTLFAKKPEAQVNNHHFIDEYDDEHRVPAWSLSRLMEFIPKCIVSTPNPLSTNYCCRNVEFDMEFYADNAVDAAYEMVVWLKENGKLYEKK